MGMLPGKIDLEALARLLHLAKSLETVLEKTPPGKSPRQVLIRGSQEGELSFQVKGGVLWRFFNITLPRREREYDLRQHFLTVQQLFKALNGHSEAEIRRAAKGLTMYGDIVITTDDAIAALSNLQRQLNAIIDRVKGKRLSRQKDENLRRNISELLDGMKIEWPLVAKAKPESQEIKKPRKRAATKLATVSLEMESA